MVDENTDSIRVGGGLKHGDAVSSQSNVSLQNCVWISPIESPHVASLLPTLTLLCPSTHVLHKILYNHTAAAGMFWSGRITAPACVCMALHLYIPARSPHSIHMNFITFRTRCECMVLNTIHPSVIIMHCNMFQFATAITSFQSTVGCPLVLGMASLSRTKAHWVVQRYSSCVPQGLFQLGGWGQIVHQME